MPRVSVCIPAYRQPIYFARALRSVLEQQFDDFEVVVTDDSPDDEIQSVVTDAADSRVVYIRNAVRLGSPANWNAAVSRARGDLVKVLHHDDWLSSSESLGAFVRLLDRAPEVPIAFSASHVCDTAQRVRRTHSPAAHLAELADDPRSLLLTGSALPAR